MRVSLKNPQSIPKKKKRKKETSCGTFYFFNLKNIKLQLDL